MGTGASLSNLLAWKRIGSICGTALQQLEAPSPLALNRTGGGRIVPHPDELRLTDKVPK